MEVALILLGIAQDGGVPHAGCSCERCMAAHIEPSLRRHPVACGVRGSDGSLHLIEASRSLPDQMRLWATTLGAEGVARPDSVSLTHVHLGHIDGLGQFGDEVMGCSGLSLFASPSVLETLAKREALGPFSATEVVPMECFDPSEGCGFEMEFVPVPHRDEHADTHAVVIRGPSRSILFLPDHDDWAQTLGRHGASSIRQWLSDLKVDIALLDGSFWDSSELPGRDMSEIPHPTVTETLARLGERVEGDAEIHFIHLNHSNPLLGPGPEGEELSDLGWQVAVQGQQFAL
jgi:pyrroloquinoline quinone biosynthesis protein B|tara:strand:+ start:72 stop:938 length:867 start_codon:yes stop_codon:yes gene_type:complete